MLSSSVAEWDESDEGESGCFVAGIILLRPESILPPSSFVVVVVALGMVGRSVGSIQNLVIFRTPKETSFFKVL